MLISVSVFTGFLNKIEKAAKGLFGDIVIEPAGERGLAYYDEFIAELTGWYYLDNDFIFDSNDAKSLVFAGRCTPKQRETITSLLKTNIRGDKGIPARGLLLAGNQTPQRVEGELYIDEAGALRFVTSRVTQDATTVSSEEMQLCAVEVRVGKGMPEVEAADPFILGMGILSVEGDPEYRQTVQISGIRLPGRARVTDFEQGLFVQENKENPIFDVSLDAAATRLDEYKKILRAIIEREFAPQLEKLTPQQREACFLSTLYMQQFLSSDELTGDQRDMLRRLSNAIGNLYEAKLRLETARLSEGELARLREELEKARKRGATSDEQHQLEEKIEDLQDKVDVKAAANRVILGLGIPGLIYRTDKGETVRYLLPGHNVFLYIVPLGKRFTSMGIEPRIGKFTIIDDEFSGVHSIDSKMVYVPFDTLQTLNNMSEDISADDPSKVVIPKRCNQIHVKVRGEHLTELDLRRVRDQVRRVWLEFWTRHPDAATRDVGIETWRQRQAQVVEPLEKQRTLVIIVIAVIWIVVVVLIFVIFYTIVTQKTREIGVLKAIGAGGGGVASIFLGYGAVVGLIGSIVGTLGGWVFVKNINAIQDWVDATFNYRVWSRDQFMFDLIPNEVDWNAAVFILASSIAAGLLGALLPAIRAARMQPVEALRYE